jgi:hypothetical protein
MSEVKGDLQLFVRDDAIEEFCLCFARWIAQKNGFKPADLDVQVALYDPRDFGDPLNATLDHDMRFNGGKLRLAYEMRKTSPRITLEICPLQRVSQKTLDSFDHKAKFELILAVGAVLANLNKDKTIEINLNLIGEFLTACGYLARLQYSSEVINFLTGRGAAIGQWLKPPRQNNE